MKNWIMVHKAYQKALAQACAVQVIILPSSLSPERFHVELSCLPHPSPIGNGRWKFRLRVKAGADIPASDRGLSDAIDVSLRIAAYMDESQSVKIADGVYAMATATPLRPDDELFVDQGADDRTNGYEEYWLVELEFDYEKTATAVEGS